MLQWSTFQYGDNLAECMKENWNHFLDDYYAVVRNYEISPEDLLLTLDSINPPIQFAMEYIQDQVALLHNLKRKYINLRTNKKVYLLHPGPNTTSLQFETWKHKPTDKQKSLPFTSSHLNHCKQNIPKTIFPISKNNVKRLWNLKNLKSNLLKYHYSDSLIKQGYQKSPSILQKTYENQRNLQMKISCHLLQHSIQKL